MSAIRREDAGDRAREEAIAVRVASAWKAEQRKTEDAASFDREITKNGKLLARVEIKVRRNPRLHYVFYMIDIAKMQALFHLSQKDGVPSFLVVKFTDGLFYVKVTPSLMVWRLPGGRKDRSDASDHDECYFFPSELFRPVG